MHGGYRLRSPFRDLDDDAYTAACVQDLRDVLDMTTSGDVACMIAEPIQGVGGFATPPDGFFGAMKEVLDEHGILFIGDEVQTGWGRTGEHFWGYQAHGIVPDLITFAKGVGNGLALGGVVATAPSHGLRCRANSISTFGGNPLVVRRRARQPRLPARPRPAGATPREVGRTCCAGLAAVVDATHVDRRAARQGPDAGDRDGATRRRHRARPGVGVAAAARGADATRGLLIGKGGLYGNVLRIAPPLSASPTTRSTRRSRPSRQAVAAVHG